jgi:hypothetical protein
MLMTGTSTRRVLAGFERVAAGPLGREHALGQSWVMELAAVQDLMDAELQWQNAARRVEELELKLLGLRGKPTGEDSAGGWKGSCMSNRRSACVGRDSAARGVSSEGQPALSSCAGSGGKRRQLRTGSTARQRA